MRISAKPFNVRSDRLSLYPLLIAQSLYTALKRAQTPYNFTHVGTLQTFIHTKLQELDVSGAGGLCHSMTDHWTLRYAHTFEILLDCLSD